MCSFIVLCGLILAASPRGYAVDRAIEALGVDPGAQSCVNAGGDLRVRGPLVERIQLRVLLAGNTTPVLEIENGSVASSSGYSPDRYGADRAPGPHVHCTRRCAVGARSFVTVLAEDCIIADGLTKVVLAKGSKA